jgi:methionyl-tRNA formyltransferase
MGTPEFARLPLEYLKKEGRHEILMVVTGPDKPSGRGRKLTATPVKLSAKKMGIPVCTPESLKDEAFLDQIRRTDADIFVVVAFRILPEGLFTLPRYGSINLHGSLLPKYRGAAPIHWALINGETETGISAFFLKRKVDTGDVILQEKIDIGPEETFDELHLRMSQRAGPFLSNVLDLIESGNVKPVVQDETSATPAPKISPFDCLIDWGLPAVKIGDFIRGLSSIPGAFTYFRGRKLKILKTRPSSSAKPDSCRPGQLVPDKKQLLLAVADGIVEILELLPEGKARITGAEFLRGFRPKEGEIFGERPKEENGKK